MGSFLLPGSRTHHVRQLRRIRGNGRTHAHRSPGRTLWAQGVRAPSNSAVCPRPDSARGGGVDGWMGHGPHRGWAARRARAGGEVIWARSARAERSRTTCPARAIVRARAMTSCSIGGTAEMKGGRRAACASPRLASSPPGVREGAATVRARVVRVGRRAGGRVACWPLVKNAWDALGAVPGVATDHFRAAFRQTRRPRRG